MTTKPRARAVTDQVIKHGNTLQILYHSRYVFISVVIVPHQGDDEGSLRERGIKKGLGAEANGCSVETDHTGGRQRRGRGNCWERSQGFLA